MGVTAEMPDAKQAFEVTSPKMKTMDGDGDEDAPRTCCMGFTARQVAMLCLIPGIYAMMTLGAEYYTPLKPYFSGDASFMKLDHEKWTTILSIHKLPKIILAIPSGFLVSMLSPGLCFISGLTGSAVALWLMWLDTNSPTDNPNGTWGMGRGNVYLFGRIVDGSAKILMLNVSEATLMAWLTKAQRPTGKGAQALGSSAANFLIGPIYGSIVTDEHPERLKMASGLAAGIVTAAVIIVSLLSVFVTLSPPSYKSKIKLGLCETLRGYGRWVQNHPRHMIHLCFTWLTVCAFEIPWGAGKGELRTILGDVWKNSIPSANWAKGPKAFQGLVSLALALTLKAGASFDTLYLVPLGAALQFSAWAILYWRMGYNWGTGGKTFIVVLSQLCNVMGYSLQYIFVCPLVFNLTYLPYAPMSIGISIMVGQGSQWCFQNWILGPAAEHKKAEILKDAARNPGCKREFGYIIRNPSAPKPVKEYIAADYDFILFWFMISCIFSFFLSMTYIFYIRKSLSTTEEPIEPIDQQVEQEADNRV